MALMAAKISYFFIHIQKVKKQFAFCLQFYKRLTFLATTSAQVHSTAENQSLNAPCPDARSSSVFLSSGGIQERRSEKDWRDRHTSNRYMARRWLVLESNLGAFNKESSSHSYAGTNDTLKTDV